MDRVIANITADFSDDTCNVDVKILHMALLKLTAEKYLELYKLMSEKIDSIK